MGMVFLLLPLGPKAHGRGGLRRAKHNRARGSSHEFMRICTYGLSGAASPSNYQQCRAGALRRASDRFPRGSRFDHRLGRDVYALQ